MESVVLFIIVSVIAGFLLTYFLSARYSILERIAYGMVVGLGLHTWIVYLLSLIWGLQFKSIYISMCLLCIFIAVFLTIKWGYLKGKIVNEITDIRGDFLQNKISYFVHIAVFSFFTTIFCRLFYRTVIWKSDGLYIGLANNYGDLPLHLAYITSFVLGDNVPPQDPSFAGEKLCYPFLSDFLSAIFLKLGLDFKDIFFIPGFLLTVSFYCILYYFTYRLTKRRLAAIISPFIFFFTGGFGFYYFFQDLANTSGSLWSFLMNLPRDYTKIEPLNYRWITPLSCLNVPQRPFLFGFPINMLIFSLLYTGIERKNWREFLFAGILAGSLPLFHTHSFLAMLMVTIPLGLVFWDWRRWFLFFMPAFVLSLPQVLYLSEHVGGEGFFKPYFGWVVGNENPFWFWLKNTTLFWPLVIGGFVLIFTFYRDANNNVHIRSGFYLLTFLIPFLLPNVMLFAPWDWDNIKILIYWFLGTIPVAALALTCLWDAFTKDKKVEGISGESKYSVSLNVALPYKILLRAGFLIIMLIITASGGIDVFRYAIAPVKGSKEFSTEEVEIAKQISTLTPLDAVFLNAPIFNHLVFMTGRKTLMGWPPHIWSHGYDESQTRENDIKIMLRGKPEAFQLVDKYKPDYAIVGPHERRIGVNKKYFDNNYSCIITTKYYNVYDLNKKKQTFQVGSKDSPDKKYGLNVYYFNNLNWEGEPVYEEVDSYIEFNYSSDNEKPVSGPFSAIWEGFIDVDITGMYSFQLASDDGSWLYIGDKLVIDNGGYHARKSANNKILLNEGKHRIKIKYFDGGGGAVLDLLWTPPGSVEEKIPAERLKIKD